MEKTKWLNVMMVELKKIMSIHGRSGRLEYWFIILFILLVVLVPAFVFFEPYSDEANKYVNVTAIITLWPLIAVQVRRWHDRNKSGWWVFINLIPLIGFVWAVIENGFLNSIDEGNRIRGQSP